MTDTHPEINAKFKRLIMARSRQTRLVMGCSMFETAKYIAKSFINNQFPGISPKQMKKEIFIHFYGLDFDEEDKEKISQYLARD